VRVVDKDITGLEIRVEAMSSTIEEVVITSKDNPAHRIIRNVIRHKKDNSPLKVEAWEAEAYNKLVISLDNISMSNLDNPLLKPAKKFMIRHQNDSTLIDSSNSVIDSTQIDSTQAVKLFKDKKYKLAIFISETISQVFYKKPEKRKETIIASKSSGVSNAESNLLSTLLTQVNIYDNWMTLLGKQFMSPIADLALTNYDYFIKNIEVNDQDSIYFLEIFPRRPYDPVFKGYMVVENKTWAVRRIDLRMNTDPNINFVEDIRIRQQFDRFDDKWMPLLSDIEVNFKNGKESIGIVGRTSTMYSKYILNQPKEDKFFNAEALEIEMGASEKDSTFWKENRKSPLEKSEQLGYDLIDTLKTQSIWALYLNIIEIITVGRKKFKYFDVGPYSQLVTFNPIEGFRTRVGIYTNTRFSKRLYLGGHLAYGFKDKRFKYEASISYRLSIKPRLEIGFTRMSEIEQVGYVNFVNDGTGIVTSALMRVPLKQLNYFTENIFKTYWDVRRGLAALFYFKTRYFEAQPKMGFEFINENGEKQGAYHTTESGISLRISFREKYIIKGGQKIYLGSKYPQFYVDGVLGFKNLLAGQFSYRRAQLSMTDRIRLGRFGYANYTVSAGIIQGTLPYPNLYVFRGSQSWAFDPIGANAGALTSVVGGTNRSSTFDPVGFNLMYFYEFIASKYIVWAIDH
ncbi:MAG: DUF5686 family protein, partial [Bacteroidia bacterium]|nr:DUF5686 family protein [Bacteroidia bacterium]